MINGSSISATSHTAALAAARSNNVRMSAAFNFNALINSIHSITWQDYEQQKRAQNKNECITNDPVQKQHVQVEHVLVSFEIKILLTFFINSFFLFFFNKVNGRVQTEDAGFIKTLFV